MEPLAGGGRAYRQGAAGVVKFARHAMRCGAWADPSVPGEGLVHGGLVAMLLASYMPCTMHV
jgi:hypothetical protein